MFVVRAQRVSAGPSVMLFMHDAGSARAHHDTRIQEAEGVDVKRVGVDVILEEVVRELRAAGISVRGLRIAPGELALQIGTDQRAVMTIVVRDRARPSFSVSYPKLRSEPGAAGQIETVRAVGLAQSRVLRLARELERVWSKGEPGKFGPC